jgi:hypothetical protein
MNDFIPQTELGRKLWDIKKKMIQNGETTDDFNFIVKGILEGRGIEHTPPEFNKVLADNFWEILS